MPTGKVLKTMPTREVKEFVPVESGATKRKTFFGPVVMKTIIICIVILIIVVILVVASSVGYASSVRSSASAQKTINQTCRMSRECNADSGLSCLDEVCSCSTDFEFKNGACRHMIVGRSCVLNDNCGVNSTLVCTNNTCMCTITNWWNGTRCIPKKALNLTCTRAEECQDYMNLACVNGSCRCAPTAFWSTNACVAKRLNGSRCSGSFQCDDTKNVTCVSGFCACDIRNFFNGSFCAAKIPINGSCANDGCNDLVGLVCLSNVCRCPPTMYWNASRCVPKRANGSSCVTTQECQDNNGLICQSGTCICNSTATRFWDGSACANRRTFGQSCSGAGQCFENRLMFCTSGTCQCNSTVVSGNYRTYLAEQDTCVVCPLNYLARQNYCYLYDRSTRTNSQALTLCQGSGAFIFEADNQTDFNWLQAFLLNQTNPVVGIHYGARSTVQNVFRRSFDNSIVPSTWFSSVSSSPAFEPCSIAHYRNRPALEDANCNDNIHVMCKKYL